MNHRPNWPLLFLLGLFSLLLTGCECDPESDAELCGARQCGTLSLIDRCDETRQLNCGTCPSHQDCQNFQCICEPESDDQLCADHAATCGSLTVTDSCMVERSIECGPCPDVGQCIDNTCRCDDEPLQSLCEIAQAQCGEVTVTDSCDVPRTIRCGDCTAPQECADNQCVCFAETDDELCADQTGACGPLALTDRCGDTRQLICQPCAVGDATFGTVVDGTTGQPLDDALIRVYEWPPAGGDNFQWVWPTGYRADDPDFGATTTAASGPTDINFEFASQEPICLGDATTASLLPHRWYRLRVDRPGYNRAYFYRYHTGYQHQDCPDLCPADDASGCQRWDFTLWPDDAAYPQYPNLIVDQRTLNDREYECAILPESSPHDRLIGLRAATGVANIGQGPFHLEGVPGGDDGIVNQYITWSDGSIETRQVESEFFSYAAAGQPRYMVWIRIALVTPSDDCRDVEHRPDDCLLNPFDKLSFCLIDSDQFDRDIMSEYGGMTPIFTDPPICSSGYNQGITQGWVDIYVRTLPGQMVILGPPSQASNLGQQWLEAYLDPRQVLHEEDTLGNVARITVDIPTDLHTVCDDPARTIDCTGPPQLYDNRQRWGCPRYLAYD